MQTEAERQAQREAYKVEAQRAQAAYDNFRYTDAQREQTIEFIGAAMNVIRGEAEFDSLTRLLPVSGTSMGRLPGTDASTSRDFDTSFLNKWTEIDVSTIPKRDGSAGFEPALFQIDFGPEMSIPRERLEKLLQLKAVHGWTMHGGNLQWEMAPLHGLPYFNGGVFVYSPLRQPQGDFDVEVKLTYLNGPDKDPWTAQRLVRLQISRDFLTAEQIKQRNGLKLGHLPQTGDRARKDGRYAALFADDALTASIPLEQRMCTYGEGQWLGPDPLASELEKLKASDGPGGLRQSRS